MPLRGDRFHELREQHGYTIDQLAEKLDISSRQIPRYEKGEVDPSADILGRIALFFSVTADYLLGLVDDPRASISEQDLSPMERKLIMALRQGLIVEALKTIATISEGENKSGVSPGQEAING